MEVEKVQWIGRVHGGAQVQPYVLREHAKAVATAPTRVEDQAGGSSETLE